MFCSLTTYNSVTLVTNILPPLTGSSTKAESIHYLSVVDMVLVPYTDLVFQFAREENSTRLPQGLHLLYPNGPKIFRRGNQLWIRSPIGFVWRDLRYPAECGVQLHPFSYWTTGPTWFSGVLSWPCAVAIVLFCALTCHRGMMNQIPVLNAILDLPLLVFNT